MPSRPRFFLLNWPHGMLVLWGSGPPSTIAEKAPNNQSPLPSDHSPTGSDNPMVFTVGWDSDPEYSHAPDSPLPDSPIPESQRYLIDRLTAIADTACNYREYHHMEIPDSIKINAQHEGLTTTAKRLRELIIELTGRDPWIHHPPAAAP